MITNSFDNQSEAKINPKPRENRFKCDACIITFSNIIEDYVLNHYSCKKVGELKFVTGPLSVYKLEYKNKVIAFYKTYMGAPTAVGALRAYRCADACRCCQGLAHYYRLATASCAASYGECHRSA